MPDQSMVEELLEKGVGALNQLTEYGARLDHISPVVVVDAVLDAVFPGWREGITREWRVAHRDGGYVNGVTGPQLAERFAAKCPTSECVVESRLLGPWVPVEEGTDG